MGDIDPQQELFTAYKLALEAMGYKVFNGGLPPEDTEYPFIHFGEFRQSDKMFKNAITGTVYPTINVWHNDEKQRGTVSKMLLDIKWVICTIDRTAAYSWLPVSLDSNIITDKTTKTPLLHGIVNAGVEFS